MLNKIYINFLFIMYFLFCFLSLLLHISASSQDYLEAQAIAGFHRATMPTRDAIVSRHIGGVIHQIATPAEVESVRGAIDALKAERAPEDAARHGVEVGGDAASVADSSRERRSSVTGSWTDLGKEGTETVVMPEGLRTPVRPRGARSSTHSPVRCMSPSAMTTPGGAAGRHPATLEDAVLAVRTFLSSDTATLFGGVQALADAYSDALAVNHALSRQIEAYKMAKPAGTERGVQTDELPSKPIVEATPEVLYGGLTAPTWGLLGATTVAGVVAGASVMYLISQRWQ